MRLISSARYGRNEAAIPAELSWQVLGPRKPGLGFGLGIGIGARKGKLTIAIAIGFSAQDRNLVANGTWLNPRS